MSRLGAPDPAELRILVDRQAIHDVVLRYCRGIDRLDRQLVASCYHPDAIEEHGTFRGDLDEFLTWVWRVLGRYDATMHYVTNCLAEPVGDVARCESYGIAWHRTDPVDGVWNPLGNLVVGFRYVDRFERRADGVWRIAARVATTEWVRERDPGAERPIPAGMLTGRRDGDDILYHILAVTRPGPGVASGASEAVGDPAEPAGHLAGAVGPGPGHPAPAERSPRGSDA